MKIVLLLTILSLAVSDVDPPIYDQPFRISFDETIVQNKTKYHVNGKMFYDPINQKSRVDRANGRYNPFCGTILSDQTTPCQQFFTNDKLWITFPAKQVCCFCCDASHGCRMSTPDALKNAVYVGRERLDQDDVLMDKWALDNQQTQFFWATADSNQIPRRTDLANHTLIVDYDVHSYENQTIPFPDGTFALPSYCNEQSFSNCPLQSICGDLRSKKKNSLSSE